MSSESNQIEAQQLPPIKQQQQPRPVPLPTFNQSLFEREDTDYMTFIKNDSNVQNFYSKILKKKIKKLGKIQAENEQMKQLSMGFQTFDSRNLATSITNYDKSTNNTTDLSKTKEVRKLELKMNRQDSLSKTFIEPPRTKLGQLELQQPGSSPFRKKNLLSTLDFKDLNIEKPDSKTLAIRGKSQAKQNVQSKNKEKKHQQLRLNVQSRNGQKDRISTQYKKFKVEKDSDQEEESYRFDNERKYQSLVVERRKVNFSEIQSKFTDNKKLRNPMREYKVSLQDKITLKRMKENSRLPIPEELLNESQGYIPLIDSLMNSVYDSDENDKWRNYRPEIDAPRASQCSDEIYLIDSEVESMKDLQIDDQKEIDAKQVTQVTLQRSKAVTKQNTSSKDVEKAVEELQIINKNKVFPERMEVAGLPLYVVRGNTLQDIVTQSNQVVEEYFQILNKTSSQEKITTTLRIDQLQQIFEYYCTEFQAQPINLTSFYKEQDKILEIRNYFLNESLVRAIACTIPVIIAFDNFSLLPIYKD
ncbi:UNKNOWN [Stylonychia lemnae]|uniref:Uncharacterized protein n=1 Tax=Stylonychia lemnae TaxID=5949 RepID=A0A077ZXZ8_STYLE|nr:UNKNOWN [Stylonychia lemnae]|eukprot:CDW74482.1 UNKNOWN [Stylonychia lemnae]